MRTIGAFQFQNDGLPLRPARYILAKVRSNVYNHCKAHRDALRYLCLTETERFLFAKRLYFKKITMSLSSDKSTASIDPLLSLPEKRSLRFIMRPPPPLNAEDSLGRALMLMRQFASDSLPVLRQGYVVGVIREADIATLLTESSPSQIEAFLRTPVSERIQPAALILRPGMSLNDVRAVCPGSNLLRCVPVADSEDYCLGIIHLHDLYVDDSPVPRPPMIGGMATPFGVYLTDGIHQAGVSNLALVASGAAMGLTLALAYAAANGLLWLAQSFLHLPRVPVVDLDSSAVPHDLISGTISVGFNLVRLLIFFVLMRLTVLAGYHAAEHQTVHAIERREPLVQEVVSRMPRAHPRCGTNLMAAALLYFTLSSVFKALPALDGLGEILALMTTVFTWRTVGTFLQERFTTRTASAHQLQSGILAGAELMTKYANACPSRPKLWRRIWCMGMIQSLIGTLLVGGIALGASTLWSSIHR